MRIAITVFVSVRGSVLLAGVAYGLIGLWSPAQVRADSAPQTALPTDLALVPADAIGFVSFRVADLWEGPLVKDLRQRASKLDSELAWSLEKGFPDAFEKFHGVAPSNVERLTIVALGPIPPPSGDLWSLLFGVRDLFGLRSVTAARLVSFPSNRPPGHPDTAWPIIIATKHPVDRQKIVAKLVDRGTGVRFVDDKTFVLSTSPGRDLPISPESSGRASPKKTNALTDALRIAAGKHAIVKGLVLADLLNRLQLPPTDVETASFVLGSHPLLQVPCGTLTVDLGVTPRLELQLSYAQKSAATFGKASLTAALRSPGKLATQEMEVVSERPAIFEAPLVKNPSVPIEINQLGNVVRASVELDKGTLIALLDSAIRKAPDEDVDNNLKQLVLAMHNYHDANKRLPPVVVTGKDGKPLYSWRVLLLPYLEGGIDLYRQFKLDERWDSPHNKPLLADMPKVFASSDSAGNNPFTTRYQVFVGKGAAFERDRTLRMADFTDGASNTILIVESPNAVPWTKPVDLPFDANRPLPKLGVSKRTFHVALADGSVRTLRGDIRPEILKALITRAGGDVVDWSAGEAPNGAPRRRQFDAGERGPAKEPDRTEEPPAERKADAPLPGR